MRAIALLNAVGEILVWVALGVLGITLATYVFPLLIAGLFALIAPRTRR